MYQTQASVEAIEKTVDTQEKQAKCMEGMVTQQYKGALTLTQPKPEAPVFGGDSVEYSNFVKAFECLIESRTKKVVLQDCITLCSSIQKERFKSSCQLFSYGSRRKLS